MVQEKAACNRLPAPIRKPQPLSQGLRPCQLPLHSGAKPRGGRKTKKARPFQAARSLSKKAAELQAFSYWMFFHGHAPGKNTVTRRFFAKNR